MAASGSTAGRFLSVEMKSSARRPDQAQRAARLSTSGRFPCAILVRVDALTPAAFATSRQLISLATRTASSAS